MSLVIVGAAITWFFYMGGKDFLWSVVKLIFGDTAKSLIPEQDDLKAEGAEQKAKEGEIVRKSEPIVKQKIQQSLLELENEQRLPANALLARRIQPRS